MVDDHLRVQNHPEVYVVGDVAWAFDAATHEPIPPTAQAAEHQGVGIDHPGERRPREMQSGLNVWQGDIHDRHIQRHHELGARDHQDGKPCPGARPASGGRLPGRE